MTGNYLTEMAENPLALGNKTIEEMDGLINKFPYFNTAYILKARALKNENDARYKEFLSMAAIYAQNREKLYGFLHAECGKREITETEIDSLEHGDELKEAEAQISPESNITIEEKVETEAVTNEGNSDHKIIDYTKTTTTKDLKDHIADAVKRQLEGTLPLLKNDEAKETDAVPEKQKQTVFKVEAGQITEQVEKKEEDYFELESAGNKVNDEKLLQDAGSANRDHDSVDQNTLIENFIKTNPRIETKEFDKLEYEDISLDSVKEDENLFTDTLARIYVEQGHYSKAIFTYEKLILKYPEKKAYFASQIEKIRHKIND